MNRLVRKRGVMLSKFKLCAFFGTISCAFLLLSFGFYCPVSVCPSRTRIYERLGRLSSGVAGGRYQWLSDKLDEFYHKDLQSNLDIEPQEEDVLVFLHIQKTGGTLVGKKLTKLMEYPCKHVEGKRFSCKTENGYIWLFSRYSTGWACGLHADWTELHDCVENQMNKKEKLKRERSYHYLTILRDPVQRYISEWRHVQRGGRWKRVRLKCNGRRATKMEWPSCYTGEDWADVSLENFLACPTNLASNRMTRMLANLSLVHCYNRTALPPSERDARLLRSAKHNLVDFAYVGITDHIVYSQYLFHRTFGLTFSEILQKHNQTHSSLTALSPSDHNAVLRRNSLDVALYDYALQLFLKRLHLAMLKDQRLARIEPGLVAELRGNRAATGYLLAEETRITAVLRRLLESDGSRHPDATEMAKRRQKWKRKLEVDLNEVDSPDAKAAALQHRRQEHAPV